MNVNRRTAPKTSPLHTVDCGDRNDKRDGRPNAKGESRVAAAAACPEARLVSVVACWAYVTVSLSPARNGPLPHASTAAVVVTGHTHTSAVLLGDRA